MDWCKAHIREVILTRSTAGLAQFHTLVAVHSTQAGQVMKFRRISFTILIAALAAFVFATPVPATGEAYGGLNGDWIWHVQDWLTHAAVKSPKWQSQRMRIEGHIENIGFLLQSAAQANRTGDYAVAGMNLQYAIKTLELGIDRGFYRRIDIEPLKLIIAQQIPGAVRPDTGSIPQEGR